MMDFKWIGMMKADKSKSVTTCPYCGKLIELEIVNVVNHVYSFDCNARISTKTKDGITVESTDLSYLKKRRKPL